MNQNPNHDECQIFIDREWAFIKKNPAETLFCKIITLKFPFTFLAATLCFGSSSNATLVMLPDPVGSAFSSEFDNNYLGEFLYDGVVTVADVGTTDNLGEQWAGSGLGPHYAVYDMGSSIELAGIFYAQRLGNDPAFDKVNQIDFWLQDSDPGVVTSDPVGTLDYSLAVTNTTNQELTEYDFGGTVGTGQYVIMKMTGNAGNPGGSELVLATIPEPGSAMLLSLLLFAGAYRRTRRL